MDEEKLNALPASTISRAQLIRMIGLAREAKTKAYAPYSNFHVGASLLGRSGEMYTGCNVENCSYGLSNCAERTAVFKAISMGERNFQAVVVTTDVTTEFTYPCGACRQVLSEFGEMEVFCLAPDGSVTRNMISELLPFAFNKETLDKMTKEAS